MFHHFPWVAFANKGYGYLLGWDVTLCCFSIHITSCKSQELSFLRKLLLCNMG